MLWLILLKQLQGVHRDLFSSFHVPGYHPWCILPLTNLPARLAFFFGIFLVLIFNQRGVAKNNICQRESEKSWGVESFLLISPTKTVICVNFRKHCGLFNLSEQGVNLWKWISGSSDFPVWFRCRDDSSAPVSRLVDLCDYSQLFHSGKFVLCFSLLMEYVLGSWSKNDWAPGFNLISYSPSSSPNPYAAMCRLSTCDATAGTSCDTTPTNEDITPPTTRNLAGVYRRRQVCGVGLESTSEVCQRLRLTWPLMPATSVLISERYRRQYRQLFRR